MAAPASLKGRPIISGPIAPTKHLSKLIGKVLSPLVPMQKSYIKDDWAFIKQLPQTLDYDAELFTCDIVSLYTSIPHDLGVEAIDFWIEKYRDKIPSRFTRDFIIESIMFILKNNNFYFDNQFYHQLEGTGMGVDFAGPYACLAVGYLERVKLFGLNMISIYTPEETRLIIQAFLRYVDDGFMFWPSSLDINIFVGILNSLNPSLKYTVERGVIEGSKESITFLSVRVTLHNKRRIETELFYKETNNHHYLEYDSFHAQHVRDNVPYGFFKKIIVFTSDPIKEKLALNQMKNWLMKCGYPQHVVEKGLHNAKLQGPAPDPSKKKDIIPFVSQNSSNYSCNSIVKKLKHMIDNCPDDSTRQFFQQKEIVQAVRQPPNILRQLTSAKFDTVPLPPTSPGTYKCKNPNCDLCKYYLVETDTVIGINRREWKIPMRITCHSKNVLYYLVCQGCNKYSKVGKTNVLRKRTNNHKSEAKSGKTSDTFDRHVFACKKDHADPVFKLYVLLEVDHFDKLLPYEDYFHKQGFDTDNRKKASAPVKKV